MYVFFRFRVKWAKQAERERMKWVVETRRESNQHTKNTNVAVCVCTNVLGRQVEHQSSKSKQWKPAIINETRGWLAGCQAAQAAIKPRNLACSFYHFRRTLRRMLVMRENYINVSIFFFFFSRRKGVVGERGALHKNNYKLTICATIVCHSTWINLDTMTARSSSYRNVYRESSHRRISFFAVILVINLCF